MIIRPKAKRRIALLGTVLLCIGLAGGLALHVANRREASRLDAERVAALAEYRAGNFAVALPHLRHYLEKTKESDQGNSDRYLDAMFAYGKSRMNVRQARLGHLTEAKNILQNYLALRPDDLDAQHTLLSIYPQIDYQQEQLTLADAVLAKHPDDQKALVAKVQALMNQTRPALAEARKVCDRLNARWPVDLQGQLLGMEIRLRMLAPPAELITRAESLHRDHEGDPRFDLLLGATYLGVSRLPAKADHPAGPAPAPAAPAPAGSAPAGSAPAAVAAPATGAGETKIAAGIAGATGASSAPAVPVQPPVAAGESARAGWRAQGLRWLQAALEKPVPDADFVRIFVSTSDLNDLYPQSLDVLRKDAPPLHDRQLDAALAQRLWENHYDQELVDRTADLDPRQPSADASTLAYRASALYELASAAPPVAAPPPAAPATAPATAPAGRELPAPPGRQGSRAIDAAKAASEAAAIVQALADRKDDPSAEAWTIVLRAEYAPAAAGAATAVNASSAGTDARELAKQCQAALAKDPENPVAFLLCGEAYARLGEKDAATARWDDAAWRAPEWSMPHALVAHMRLAQGRNDEALVRASAALARSPQIRAVRAVYVLAWHAVLKDSPRDWARDGPWDRLLGEVRAVQEQWPHEPETLPLYVTLLAESGRKGAAAEAAKDAAVATPPPPTETLLALDEVSRSQGLGLGDLLVRRADSADRNSLGLALRRATDLLRANDAAAGLAGLKDAQKAAGAGNDPAWRAAVADYLERAGDPAAAKTWIDLGDNNPSNLLVQSAVLQSAARFQDRAFWKRSIDRLKALTGDEGQLWRLERCRWLLTGDAAPVSPTSPTATGAPNASATGGSAGDKDRAEAMAILTGLTREFPGEAEAHRLLAVAFEREGKPDRAADEWGVAVSLRPGDVEASLELTRLLRATGKGTEARAVLDRAARRPDLAAADRRLLASAYEQEGSPQRAVQLLTAGPAGAADNVGNAGNAGNAGPATRAAPGGTAPVTPAPLDAAGAARDGMLARLYGRLGQFDKAEELYAKLLEDPSAPPQDLADGAELFASQGKSERASEFLTRLAGMNLPPGAIQVIMGRFHERFGAADDALRSFTEATTVAPKAPGAWRELAGFHLRHGRLAEAAAAAGQGVKAAPGDAALSALVKDVSLLQRYPNPALLVSLYDALANDPADPAAADLLQALLDSRDHNDSAAQRTARLKAVAGRHPEFFPAQEQLILAYLGERQYQSAIDVATDAVQANPYDPAPARLATGVYLTAGQTARALDAAMTWRQRSGTDTLPADLAVADALVTLDRPREAVRRLAPYLSKPAADPPPPARANPATPAVPSAPSAPSPGPATAADFNPTLYRVYCRALIAAGRPADASALLAPFLSATGGDTAGARRLWLALASAAKSADAASAWLDQVAPRLQDDSPEDRFALAAAWRQVGSQFSSVPALQKARDLLAPMIHRPGAAVSAWALAAEVAQELGDYDTAEQGWRRLLQDATATGKTAAPEVRNNLAYVLMIRGEKSSLPEAQQLAEQAVAAAPDSAVFYDTLARIESRQGRREQAVKAFRTALDKDPSNVEAMIGLADELSHGGTRDDAATARSLLVKINRLMEKSPSLSGPLQEELKSVRTRASLDAGEGR